MSDPSRNTANGSRHWLLARYGPPAMLLCAGILLSLLLSGTARDWERGRINAAFEQRAAERVWALERELELTVHGLEALAAFYAASELVTRQEFRTFVQPFLAHHADVQALEWVPRVPDAERAAYEEAARSDGFPGFRIAERKAHGEMAPAARREEYFPVYYVEPYEGNETALGFDLASNPARLEALNRARDTGQMAATGRITLVQETGQQFGFLLFIPVYRKDAPALTVQERRDNLEGFCLAVFRIGDIMEEALTPLAVGGIDVCICDHSAPEGEGSLYFHSSRTRPAPIEPIDDEAVVHAGMRREATLDVGGRQWLVVCRPVPAFFAGKRTAFPWVILIAGPLVTALGAAYIFLILNRAARETKARRHLQLQVFQRLETEAALRESERTLGEAELIAQTGNWDADLQGGETRWSDGLCRLLGLAPGTFDASLEAFLSNYVHPDDRERVAQSVAQALSREEPFDLKLRIILPDGSERILHARAEVTFDDNGKAARMLGTAHDITERKRAEKEIARLARFPSENPNPVLRVSNNGTVLYANAAAEPLLNAWGCETDHPLPDEWRAVILDAFKCGSSRRREVECDDRVLSLTLAPVADAGYVNVYGLDITERKRAEEALRESEDKYRSIIETSRDWIWEIDRQGKHTYSNQSVEAILGYRPDELPGLDTYELMHEEDGAPVREKVSQCAAEKRGWTGLVIRWRHKDGGYRFLESNAVPVLDAGGELVGFRGTDRDVTERKQVEGMLQELARQWQTTFDAMNDGVALLDMKGSILRCNKAMAALLGKPIAEITGETCWELIHQAEGPIEGCPIERMRHSRRRETLDLKVGEEWLRATVDPLFDENNALIGAVHILSDITGRKQAEEQQRDLEAQMQHAQKLESLGVLAGGIAHDFNNLLAVVLGHADLALAKASPTSPLGESIGEIKGAAVRASDLTRQMLAYSGKGEFVVEPLDLNELVEEMAHLLRTSISKKAVLKFDFAEALPPIEADAAQIQQVVMNLITNASDAIGDTPGVITLTTGTMQANVEYLAGRYVGEDLPEGSYVFLEVSDTGCGMDEETREKIFDPFFTTKFTGLGLAAALGIVRGHGGAIKVYTEPGSGTTFRALFPPSERALETSSAKDAAQADAPRASGTILVVDDEEAVGTVARVLLEHAGFTVLVADKARDGVEAFREHADRIEAVLLDMTMPEMSGEEVFHEIRRIDPAARIILTSGYSEHDATSHFAGEGLAGFVHKPFELDTLIGTVRQAVEA